MIEVEVSLQGLSNVFMMRKFLTVTRGEGINPNGDQ